MMRKSERTMPRLLDGPSMDWFNRVHQLIAREYSCGHEMDVPKGHKPQNSMMNT